MFPTLDLLHWTPPRTGHPALDTPHWTSYASKWRCRDSASLLIVAAAKPGRETRLGLTVLQCNSLYTCDVAIVTLAILRYAALSLCSCKYASDEFEHSRDGRAEQPQQAPGECCPHSPTGIAAPGPRTAPEAPAIMLLRLSQCNKRVQPSSSG